MLYVYYDGLYSTMDKKKLRNLTTEEIIGQIMLGKSGLDDWMANVSRKNGNELKITNVVMMGIYVSIMNQLLHACMHDDRMMYICDTNSAVCA